MISLLCRWGFHSWGEWEFGHVHRERPADRQKCTRCPAVRYSKEFEDQGPHGAKWQVSKPSRITAILDEAEQE